MAAGLGTRLRPITHEIPKPVVPVGNVAIVEQLVAPARRARRRRGDRQPALVPGARSSGGSATARALGVEMTYRHEEELLGTAGGVRNVADFLDRGRRRRLPRARRRRAHRRRPDGARWRPTAPTAASRRSPSRGSADVSEYGVIVTGADGRVQGFQEKPDPAEALSDLVNCMVYAFSPEVFDYFPRDEMPDPVDFANDVFPALLDADVPFHVHEIDGYWNDVGTLREYLQGNLDAVAGAVELPRSAATLADGELAARRGDVEVEGRVLFGEGCRDRRRRHDHGPGRDRPRGRDRRRGAGQGGGAAAGRQRRRPASILARGIAGDASSPRLRRLVSALAQRSRTVHVPASSGNLGPGYDVLGAALGHRAGSSRSRRRARSRSTPGGSTVPADRANLVVRAFERLHPADGISFRIGSEIPLARGLGSSAAAIVAGLLAADHLFELGNSREGIFELRLRDRGPPRQRRRGAVRRDRGVRAATDSARHSAPDPIELAAGTAPASSLSMPTLLAPPEGLEAILVIPDEEVSTEAARAAMPAEVPIADAVAQRRRRRAARARDRALRPDPDRARPRRPAAPAAPPAALPALDGAWSRRRAASARSARRSPAPARPCSSGATGSRARASSRASRRSATGWAEVVRVPFSPRGARVELR